MPSPTVTNRAETCHAEAAEKQKVAGQEAELRNAAERAAQDAKDKENREKARQERKEREQRTNSS